MISASTTSSTLPMSWVWVGKLLSFRCYTASGGSCNSSWLTKGIGCGCICHTGSDGTPSCCGAWPSARQTYCYSCAHWSEANRIIAHLVAKGDVTMTMPTVGMTGNFKVPKPANEPPRSYAPGSPEAGAVLHRIEQLSDDVR